MLRYRLIFACNLLVLAALLLITPAAAAEQPEAQAEIAMPRAAAAVLIEAHTGELIFGLNEESALPPASTTKILTALLALDMGADMERLHTISAEAAAVEESSLYLRQGEQLSLTDLLKGALVHSGNDACYAIGEIIAGSERLFVHWMNMKAAVLGADSVQMTNTNGLPDPQHQMSAADLARLAAFAMQDETFAAIVGSKTIELGQGASYRYYQNTNKLLWSDEHIVGIKTGTTDAAGPCLAAAYQDGAALYISVLFNSPDRYGESLALLRSAAEEYVLIYWPCRGKALAYTEEDGLLLAQHDLQAVIRRDQLGLLRLVWRLAAGQNSLSLVDAAGQTLADCDLAVANN